MTELLLYTDFETTGLDEKTRSLIEAGIVLTRSDFTELGSIDTLIRPVYFDEDGEPAWDDFAKDMAKANGLHDDIERGLMDDSLITLDEFEQQVLSLICGHANPGDTVVISGSGVATFDFRWIKEQLRDVAVLLAYYPNDVGILRRSFRRANGFDLTPVNKDKTHRAMQDVRCHMEEDRVFHEFLARHGKEYAA
jgi:oligoribonuclease (3'-5' exoribonuclease)